MSDKQDVVPPIKTPSNNAKIIAGRMPWHVRTHEECDKILTAPGRLAEIEQDQVYGRVLRVYKNLPKNMRTFFLGCTQQFQDRDYIVFENDRYTYKQAFEHVSRIADLLYTKYAVCKGDRVAIIMRNCPRFLLVFWAAHLIGAIATMVNAWLPSKALMHCLTLTSPKVIFLDSERADRLHHLLGELRIKIPLHKILVVQEIATTRIGHSNTNASEIHEEGTSATSSSSRSQKGWRWGNGISSLEDALASYTGPVESWRSAPELLPDDDATIFFTSGTTGLPKGVLSSHRAFLTNFLVTVTCRQRVDVRKGEDIDVLDANAPQAGALISVPLFHVTGLTAFAMLMTATGGKIALMRKWDKDEAARIILKEKITLAGGVPSTVMDLIESNLPQRDIPVQTFSCGGAPPAENMPQDVRKRFPTATASQAYGLTETNAVVALISGEEFEERPTSCGRASLVNDILIVDPATRAILSPGRVGELWIKGPNVMKGYWKDPVATDQVITKDGWFKTGDLALIDEEGFLFIKDRVKDIIIRGGENIHCTEVENALYADERILDAAAVSVSDKRLGELVAAVVAVKPAFRSKGIVKEEELIKVAKQHLAAHAVPVMILIQDDFIERNENGKILKNSVRKRVRKEWDRRLSSAKKHSEAGKNAKAKL